MLNHCFECKPQGNFYCGNVLAFPLNFPSSEQRGKGEGIIITDLIKLLRLLVQSNGK